MATGQEVVDSLWLYLVVGHNNNNNNNNNNNRGGAGPGGCDASH